MPPSVLFIAGLGRSGSTLLARLLGEAPGVFNAGECARYLLTSHMYERDLPCSCTLSPRTCQVWREIVPMVSDDDRTMATDLLRIRHMYRWSSYRDDRLSDLRQSITAVYERVAERSGCDVIVDSSKHPALARLLSASNIPLHVLHLVRDPRAVVASRRQPKSYLGAMNPGRVAASWIGFNLATETLARRVLSYRRIRYEDFVDRPAENLFDVLLGVTQDRPRLDFIEGNEALVRGQHALAGNPDKFDSGRLVIQSRSNALSRTLHWAITAETLPFLLRYGYQAGPR